jgi:FkbM family methyltransferase
MSLLLEPGSTFIDVGANIGFETVLAAKAVGATGSVLSFEPSGHNHELLLRNINLNAVEKVVQTFPFGLSDRDAEHMLHFSTDNRGGAFLSNMDANEFYETEESVRTKVLDDISDNLVERCDLIKVDIEGHEPSFLRGSLRFLDTYQPACILEANHWCLDALTNVTMPDYLKQVREIFPYVYAFDQHEIVDVREREIHFLVENIVHSRFANLYCDFDARRVADVVARYSRFLLADTAYANELERRNAELQNQLNSLSAQLDGITRSRSHRLAVTANRLLRR